MPAGKWRHKFTEAEFSSATSAVVGLLL